MSRRFFSDREGVPAGDVREQQGPHREHRESRRIMRGAKAGGLLRVEVRGGRFRRGAAIGTRGEKLFARFVNRVPLDRARTRHFYSALGGRLQH